MTTLYGFGRRGVAIRHPDANDSDEPIPLYASAEAVQSVIDAIHAKHGIGVLHVIEYQTDLVDITRGQFPCQEHTVATRPKAADDDGDLQQRVRASVALLSATVAIEQAIRSLARDAHPEAAAARDRLVAAQAGLARDEAS